MNPLASPLEPAAPHGGVGVNTASSSQQVEGIQQLVDHLEKLPDPVLRALLHECLQSLLAFYGDGLARMLHAIEEAGPEAAGIIKRLTADKVVSGLLIIHGLHPLDLASRVRAALDTVRPYMESHGGNVELIGLEGEVARLRLQGACKSCPSSAVTMELAVRRALEEACPDLLGLELEGVAAPPHGSRNFQLDPAQPIIEDGAMKISESPDSRHALPAQQNEGAAKPSTGTVVPPVSCPPANWGEAQT